MSREYRDWKSIDAVQYFNEHYKGKITSRKQLSEEDQCLYNKLRIIGKLDQILPSQHENHRDFTQNDPMQYFKKFHAGKITTRSQLKEGDPGLYEKLRKLNKLDEVLPDLQRRDFSQIDPIQHFNQHYKGKITSRKQLAKEDSGLYNKLYKLGKLDEVLPRQLRDFSKKDPVQHFKEQYKGKITSRKQLEKEDQVLYDKLRKLGKLDEILASQHENNRDYTQTDPVQFFNQHYKGKVVTRTQLSKEDPGLYQKLRKQGQLDEILPSQYENHRDYTQTDPVQFFNQHYKGKITTRKQLQKEDQGLYCKLLRIGKLEDVLPDRQNRDFAQIDPIQYFNQHYKGKITSRKQLEKGDRVLYHKLCKLGKLDEILPDQNESHRDYTQTDPVQYFNQHYKGKITSRKHLQKEDSGLYDKLRRLGKLDEVFPKKSSLDDILRKYTDEDETTGETLKK